MLLFATAALLLDGVSCERARFVVCWRPAPLHRRLFCYCVHKRITKMNCRLPIEWNEPLQLRHNDVCFRHHTHAHTVYVHCQWSALFERREQVSTHSIHLRVKFLHSFIHPKCVCMYFWMKEAYVWMWVARAEERRMKQFTTCCCCFCEAVRIATMLNVCLCILCSIKNIIIIFDRRKCLFFA